MSKRLILGQSAHKTSCHKRSLIALSLLSRVCSGGSENNAYCKNTVAHHYLSPVMPYMSPISTSGQMHVPPLLQPDSPGCVSTQQCLIYIRVGKGNTRKRLDPSFVALVAGKPPARLTTKHLVDMGAAQTYVNLDDEYKRGATALGVHTHTHYNLSRSVLSSFNTHHQCRIFCPIAS